MRVFFLFILAVLLMTFPIEAQAQQGAPPVPPEAGMAATEALRTFAKLVTRENYAAMGFETPDEVQAATLGVPARDFVVPLDVLQRYDGGMDPRELLTEGMRVIYPVMVKEITRSSIDVVKGKERWFAASFGAPNLIRRLSRVRDAKSKELQRSPSEFFIVRVPALKLCFLGHFEGAELILTPVVGDARFGFGEGKSLSAKEVFRVILPVAKETKDIPS